MYVCVYTYIDIHDYVYHMCRICYTYIHIHICACLVTCISPLVMARTVVAPPSSVVKYWWGVFV